MNDILFHQELHHDAIDRHQHEARSWAQRDALARLSRATQGGHVERRNIRLVVLAAPMAAVLALLAILI